MPATRQQEDEWGLGFQVADWKSPPTVPVTFEEFHDWCDSGTRAEWVNGNVILMAPATLRHQEIVVFLICVLSSCVRALNLGTTIFRFLMRMRPLERARMPDLIFVSHERMPQLRHTYMDGAADMVVEIVSPDSIERDRIEKLSEYAAAGVREYWLVDPLQQTADFYEPGPNGCFQPIPLAEGVFHSRVVDGFFLRVADLWQDPLPSPRDLLRELGAL